MPDQNQLTDAGASRRFLPLLLLLFAGSGCSALVYEIVWYQLLQLVIGSTAVSLGVLLATFMGGLCLGSLALPRIRSLGGRHPLRVYALVELGIGVCGILVLLAMPLVDRVYVAAVGHGLPAMLLRAVVAAACLLPPTVLMGASLPAASRWLKTTPEGVSWMGLLYGGNTAGAVFGCLLAGFYLLRVHDMATATLVAAALNGVVALISFGMASRTPHQADAEEPAATPMVEAAPRSGAVYVTIALSGACALGAEVVWTRLLGLLLGATVYTFSIILAVFLVGLGIGSGVAAALVRGVARPRLALGCCQLLLSGAVAWTAYMLANSLPYWPINPLLSTSPWFTFQIDLARSTWAILPAALLWGASFPLALAALASRGRDAGRMVGGIYAANTAGAIVGALAFSMFLVPAIGTQGCERVLIVLSVVSALFALAPPLRAKAGVLLLAAAVVAVVLLAMSVSGVPSMLIAYGRRITTSANRSQILYAGEGMNASIAISRWDDGAVQFHVSGKVEASTEPYDMRLQRMLGHMPALLHSNPRSVLVVGFGAGVTAGSFVLHPEVKRIVICEMERMIPPVATRFFGRENNNVLNDPRVEMVYDDARHYVLTTRENFDVITSDPIHPWVKGSATLYSKEYFEMVKQHLNPGGIVTQWVPLYETDLDTVKSEMATFFDVFPSGTIWGNDTSGGGYDTVLLGQAEPTKIDVDQLQEKLERPDQARVAASMREVGFGSAIALLSTYAGQGPDLKSWLVDAEINRDGNLRLQYLAGLALNKSMEGAIYSQMLTYRRYPENLFVVSDQLRPALMAALSQ
jgi:spermidine synthase